MDFELDESEGRALISIWSSPDRNMLVKMTEQLKGVYRKRLEMGNYDEVLRVRGCIQGLTDLLCSIDDTVKLMTGHTAAEEELQAKRPLGPNLI